MELVDDLLLSFSKLMFVIGTFCCYLSPLVLGFVLDAYGPRLCSIAGSTCVGVGFLLFSLCDTNHAPYFTISISLIAFGGTGNQLSM